MNKEKIKTLHYTQSLCNNWDWFTTCENVIFLYLYNVYVLYI